MHWTSAVFEPGWTVSHEFREWAEKQPSFAQAWQMCRNPAWLLWFAARVSQSRNEMERIISNAVWAIEQILSELEEETFTLSRELSAVVNQGSMKTLRALRTHSAVLEHAAGSHSRIVRASLEVAELKDTDTPRMQRIASLVLSAVEFAIGAHEIEFTAWLFGPDLADALRARLDEPFLSRLTN